MAIQPLRLNGGWSGVCRDGIARLVDMTTLVVSPLDAPKTVLWQRTVGPIRNVDCWSHETTGEIRVGYTNGQTGFDIAHVLSRTGDPVELGKGKSIVLRRKDDRWVAMLSHPDGKWTLLDVDTLDVLDRGQDVRWSSLGIIDIAPNWTPVWAYTHQTIGGFKVEHARRSGLFAAGQGSNPSSLLVAHGQTVGRLLLGEAREVKACDLGDGRAAFISRVEGGYGVAFAILTPADIASLPKPGTSLPTPDPDEPPDDGDEIDMPLPLYQKLTERLARVETKLDRVLDALDELPDPPPPPDVPPTPPSPDAPDVKLSDITWLGPDVSGWAETSQITDVTIRQGPREDDGTVCFPHTKAGKWPTFSDGAGEGNVWVVGQVNGRWYAAPAEWLKPGQYCKRFTAQVGPPAPNNWGIGPHTKKAPLESWSPKSGEWTGWITSTRARDSKRSVDADGNEVLERSNLYWKRWP